MPKYQVIQIYSDVAAFHLKEPLPSNKMVDMGLQYADNPRIAAWAASCRYARTTCLLKAFEVSEDFDSEQYSQLLASLSEDDEPRELKMEGAGDRQYIQSFPWNRVSDDLINEVMEVLHRNGFNS